MYRVSTGNYEYRLILRCRQEARLRFAKMRKDVLEKLELLDQKHGNCSATIFLFTILHLGHFFLLCLYFNDPILGLKIIKTSHTYFLKTKARLNRIMQLVIFLVAQLLQYF